MKMSKVLTPSPRCRRAAAVSQDRLNVPSFKSSHFFPQDHSFLRSLLKKRLSCWKGDSTVTFPWFLQCQQWFLCWLCSYNFFSTFFCLCCSTGSAAINNNPFHNHTYPSSMPHYFFIDDINYENWVKWYIKMYEKPDWNYKLFQFIYWKWQFIC